MRQPVTASLLHGLVAGSHAQGTTRLAVVALIEDHDQILLVEADNPLDTSGQRWELPKELVWPGETLTDAVARTAATAGIDLDHITGYLGHHDLPTSDGLARAFVFATTGHPRRGPYQWAAIDDLPDGLDHDMLCLIHLADNPHRPHRLSTALLAHACLLADQAAIELLIDHRCWLARPDFVDRYITTRPGTTAATLIAWVDWPAAITALDTGTLPCSGSEAQMLRLAASLAHGSPLDLRDALTGLDTDNLHIVAQAILHTGGH